MIFMVVFEALTNGLKAAILVGTGLECLLYFLDANVAALRRSERILALVLVLAFLLVLAGAGLLAVLLRFLLARAFRAFRTFRAFKGF